MENDFDRDYREIRMSQKHFKCASCDQNISVMQY